MKAKAFQFSARAQTVLLALAQALIAVPQGLVLHNSSEEYLQRCVILVREFQPLFRVFLLLSLWVFDRMTVIFGFGLRRFVNLDQAQQARYAQKLLASRIGLLRNLVMGLRGLVVFAFCSHKDVWAYIGYDPVAHARERIRLREELVGKRELGNVRT